MVMLSEGMDRAYEEEVAVYSEASFLHGNEVISEPQKASAECHEASSPLSVTGDNVVRSCENSYENGTCPANPTPDQMEMAARLLAHKDICPPAPVTEAVLSTARSKAPPYVVPKIPDVNTFSSDSSHEFPIGDETSTNPTSPSTRLLPTHSRDEEKDEDFSRESPHSDSRSSPGITSKSLSAVPSSKAKQVGSLRRGKWTVEEEAYVARVIQDFNSGFLDAPAGTTLRTYLSDKLKCDPMRITKKFTGEACIGKRVFHPAVRTASNTVAISKAQAELETLERRWRRRLEMQQRESVKKASVAVATAASSGRTVFGLTSMAQSDHSGVVESSCEIHSNPIAVTASWLDRAKNVLKEASVANSRDEQTQELEDQIQEVQRLIHEGPSIQQTSHELPQILDHVDDSDIVAAGGADDEPADKRLRTAEDAEALVGFLRSVRASAAQGQTF